jgi:hypothetical protein
MRLASGERHIKGLNLATGLMLATGAVLFDREYYFALLFLGFQYYNVVKQDKMSDTCTMDFVYVNVLP